MKTVRKQRFIISLVLSGFMLPYVGCIQASWWWADNKTNNAIPETPVTKTGPNIKNDSLPVGSFVREEAEIMAEVMPTLVRKLIYTAIATAFVSYIMEKPIQKLYKLIMPDFIQDFFKDDDDDDESVSGKHRNKIRKPKYTIEDLANQKLPKEMEDHINEVDNEIKKREIKKQKKIKTREITSRHLILYGPTGSGKTFSVEAYANALGKRFNKKVKILIAKGSDIINKYVGGTPKLIRKLAKNAKAASKSYFGFGNDNIVVIVMNEFDSLFMGKKGEAEYGHTAANEFQNTLDEDINPNNNLFFVGTTNRIHEIPPATRNRFTCIEIESPKTKKEIEKHITNHIKDIKNYLNNEDHNFDQEIEAIKKYISKTLEKFVPKLQEKFEGEANKKDKTDILLNRRDLDKISKQLETYILLHKKIPTKSELNLHIKNLMLKKKLARNIIAQIISNRDILLRTAVLRKKFFILRNKTILAGSLKKRKRAESFNLKI